MELLGDRNWWLPEWLSSRLPRVTVEPVLQGHEGDVGTTVAVARGGSSGHQDRSLTEEPTRS